MSIDKITQDQILEQLRELEPDRWFEVLDFIGYLRHREAGGQTRPEPQALTARDLLQSGLVGLWADRDDIGDSILFARRLRQEAEHRGRTAERREGDQDDPA